MPAWPLHAVDRSWSGHGPAHSCDCMSLLVVAVPTDER